MHYYWNAFHEQSTHKRSKAGVVTSVPETAASAAHPPTSMRFSDIFSFEKLDAYVPTVKTAVKRLLCHVKITREGSTDFVWGTTIHLPKARILPARENVKRI